jgi:hypothetical protein
METKKKSKPKPKKKEYQGSLTLTPFFFNVTIIISDDFNYTVERLGIDNSCMDKAGLSVSLESGDHMLIFDRDGLDHGIIAHEAAHCIFEALDSVGQDPVKAEETFTYLLQYVVNFIGGMCKKYKIAIE